MIKFISRFIVLILINTLALYAADRLIDGFAVSQNLSELLTAGLGLTLFNLVLLPFLKIIFSPLIFLTFGLVGFFINALALYLLANMFKTVIIDGFIPLLLATLVIGIINAICQRLILSKS